MTNPQQKTEDYFFQKKVLRDNYFPSTKKRRDLEPLVRERRCEVVLLDNYAQGENIAQRRFPSNFQGFVQPYLAVLGLTREGANSRFFSQPLSEYETQSVIQRAIAGLSAVQNPSKVSFRRTLEPGKLTLSDRFLSIASNQYLLQLDFNPNPDQFYLEARFLGCHDELSTLKRLMDFQNLQGLVSSRVLSPNPAFGNPYNYLLSELTLGMASTKTFSQFASLDAALNDPSGCFIFQGDQRLQPAAA